MVLLVAMALIRNKKATFDFELGDRFEAGIELRGYEVKSIRQGHGKLEGAHVIVRGGEAYLIGADIPAFQKANAPKSYDSTRPRRLLLSKKEIGELLGAESQKGQTVVAVSIYAKGSKLKLECAIARGKKKHDKRETLKKKAVKRDIEREVSGRN